VWLLEGVLGEGSFEEVVDCPGEADVGEETCRSQSQRKKPQNKKTKKTGIKDQQSAASRSE
jgi:hypothetical protein